MSKYPRANVIRAARLLSETVKVGSFALEADIDPEEQVTASRSASEVERDALHELKEEVSRLEAALKDAQREIRDFVARLSLSEQELNKEKERSAAEYGKLEAAHEAEFQAIKKSAEAKGVEEGRKRGYNEGLLKAREEISKEYERSVASLVAQLEGVHAALAERTEGLAALAMPRLVRLWELMLSKMLHHEVEVSEDAVRSVLKDVLERLSDRERLVVYLNPSDVERTSERKDVFGDLLRGVRHLEFIPDANVEQGSCIVETNLGIYDARWRTQLEQIHEEIERLFIEGRKNDEETG